MGAWTIQTTDAEDEAINYSYQQSLNPPVAPAPMSGVMGMVPFMPPPMPMPPAPTTPPAPGAKPAPREVETVEAYFDRTVHATTISTMTMQHQRAKATELLSAIATIPPENRDAAQADLEILIVKHGGTVEDVPKPETANVGNAANVGKAAGRGPH